MDAGKLATSDLQLLWLKVVVLPFLPPKDTLKRMNTQPLDFFLTECS
jgi:hypothetical protein